MGESGSPYLLWQDTEMERYNKRENLCMLIFSSIINVEEQMQMLWVANTEQFGNVELGIFILYRVQDIFLWWLLGSPK
jgi:hypothetical protein